MDQSTLNICTYYLIMCHWATAACLRDVFSHESSGENLVELKKIDNEVSIFKETKRKKKHKESSSANEKDEKGPFFRLFEKTCHGIEKGMDKIVSNVEAS